MAIEEVDKKLWALAEENVTKRQEKAFHSLLEEAVDAHLGNDECEDCEDGISDRCEEWLRERIESWQESQFDEQAEAEYDRLEEQQEERLTEQEQEEQEEEELS